MLKFLEIKRAEGKQRINLFSDRCGGQNQNRMVFIMLSNAVTDLKLKKIELTFLVPGHFQNENDTAHSVIESHYRNRFVYTPNQNDIIDFKNVDYFPQYSTVLADKCFPEEVKVSKAKVKKVMWSEIVQLKVIEEDPCMLYFKYNYSDEYKKCNFRVESATTRSEKDRVAKKQKYHAKIGITAAKKKDLLTLCKKGYIPKNHHAFYESLAFMDRKEDDDVHVVLSESDDETE